MRKLQDMSVQDLLPAINSDFCLVDKRQDELELWFRGDDWGKTDAEKEELYDSERYTSISSKIGTITLDTSGNVTALELGDGMAQYKSVLFLLCAFLADDRNLDGYSQGINLEMEPDGHLIRIKVVVLDAWPSGEDDGVEFSSRPVGVITYDSELKAFLKA